MRSAAALCSLLAVAAVAQAGKAKKPKAEDSAKCVACRRMVSAIEDDIIRKLFPLDQEIDGFSSSPEPLERSRQKEKKQERQTILFERLPRICDTTGFFFRIPIRDACNELNDEFETQFLEVTSDYRTHGGRQQIAEYICSSQVTSACPKETDYTQMQATTALKHDDPKLRVQKLPELAEQILGEETLLGTRWMYDVNGPMLVDLLEASEIGEIDVLVYYYTEKGVENSEFGGKYAPALQIFAQDLAIALSAEPDDVAPPMVVCMLDLDKNDVPRPWGNFMDVSTIVFYPSADPTNPQFLIDAVSPSMDIDNLGSDTFWAYATRPELGASPRTLRIGNEHAKSRSGARARDAEF